ncbi:hypothetical protein H072_998 [Dactylellina haptotyla CBS 200.50]|uniref:Cyanovirin-N domain-containing protein n=1 Tax=Dactylellina haptotyla (strain CBS 200.50) TaxID=1284197 RepID=S8CBH9_DACHA|nr:hypothetical protein H072_998 [Dactylellina haptotyla CBS 200.50]
MKFSYAALLGLVPSTFAASLPASTSQNAEHGITKRGGGAFGSCVSPSFEKRGDQVWMNLNCGDGRGGWHWNHINLNECIGNHDGNLVWQRNGGFGGSCWLDGDATGSKYNHFLYIFCGNGRGGNYMRSIDLDEHLVNRDGYLKCEL